MGHLTGSIADWPLAAWVVLIAIAVFIGKYALLRWQWAAYQASASQAERRLYQAAAGLREYAGRHLQRLPERLEETGFEPAGTVAYRPVPRLGLDERLILLHDAGPARKVLEFPSLRDGRGVVFCSGRMLVVTEEAFEKLLAADDALRERLGLNRPCSAAEDDSSGCT